MYGKALRHGATDDDAFVNRVIFWNPPSSHFNPLGL